MSNADFHTQTAMLSRIDRFDDEIDLIALVASLWRRRVAIVAVAAAVVAMAVGYLLLATPVYQTSMEFKEANSHELARVNIPGVFALSPAAALSRIQSGLNSYEQRFLFFQQHQDLYNLESQIDQSLEQTYANYDKDSFSIGGPDPKADGERFVDLTLNYSADTKGVEILRQFAAWVQQRELESIEKDIRRVINTELQRLQLQLTESRKGYAVAKEAQIVRLLEADRIKRQNLLDEKAAIKAELKSRRDNRIKQLEEALVVAESLGIKRPSYPLWESTSALQERSMGVEVGTANLPLYLMGTEVLKSERKALLARKNDDFTEPRLLQLETELAMLETNRLVESLRARSAGDEDIYLENFSDIQKSIAKLNAIKPDLDGVNLVKIDRDAIEPLRPIKPRKALVLAVAVVLGGMLGLFVALVLNMVESAKKRTALPAPARVELPSVNVN